MYVCKANWGQTKKILKLKEVLNVICWLAFKNEIQMVSFYNLISIENVLALSVHYFEIFSDIYCDCCYFQPITAYVRFSYFKKSTLLAEARL